MVRCRSRLRLRRWAPALCVAGTLAAAAPAHAFCGFFVAGNDAMQKEVLRLLRSASKL